MNGTIVEFKSDIMMESQWTLQREKGYIVLVNNLLVTVHCSFLYFGLVSTVD